MSAAANEAHEERQAQPPNVTSMEAGLDNICVHAGAGLSDGPQRPAVVAELQDLKRGEPFEGGSGMRGQGAVWPCAAPNSECGALEL